MSSMNNIIIAYVPRLITSITMTKTIITTTTTVHLMTRLIMKDVNMKATIVCFTVFSRECICDIVRITVIIITIIVMEGAEIGTARCGVTQTLAMIHHCCYLFLK